MAIRSVALKCIFPGNYSARDAFEKEHEVSLYPHLRLRGMKVGEGIEIAFYNRSEEKSALARTFIIVSEDKIEYEGCVLRTHSREERVMSDVYAICYYADVWVDGTLKTVRTGCSEFSGNWDATLIEVDATDAVKADYEAYQAGARAGAVFAECERAAAREIAFALAEKRRIEKGKVVRVVKGRKVPQGTQGRVFWMRDDQWGMRLGIATSERKNAQGHYADVAWVAASNCAVVNEASGEVF